MTLLTHPNLPPPPTGKYPAKAHAERVVELIRQEAGDDASDGHGKGVIFLEGQKTQMVEDDDQTVPFRQRRYFYYLSGCNLPDSYLVYNIESKHLTLFIPPVDADDVIWSGMPTTEKEALEQYDIDSCYTTDQLSAFLTSNNQTQNTLYAIPEQISPHIPLSSFPQTDLKTLKPAIERSRVIKDAYEIALIRHANAISSHAHANVMRIARHAKNEAELMGTFVGTCIANGGREQAYSCICASGPNAATLHYVHNDLVLGGKLNLLIDAGCEFGCYCADITRTYPLSGTFSAESRAVYDVVDRMQSSCMSMLKAGVLWEDVHSRAHQIAIEGLLHLGILRGDKQEILENRVSTLFFPHGLGHYLGMDCHDSGGNANYADPDPMFKYLRIRGRIPKGAVVTNEPGVYFCRFIIEPALKDEKMARFIDEKVLEKYWTVGGVRIEDDVHILEGGCENLTTAPRSWKEVEALINA